MINCMTPVLRVTNDGGLSHPLGRTRMTRLTGKPILNIPTETGNLRNGIDFGR